MKKWFEIINKAEKSEIWIYEQIGEDFWTGDGITAKSFQKELALIKASQIDLHINSPGGEVFDGITIYNLIKQHPANVTTYIDGLAASIASVIALAGNTVIMAENALFMIHNPYGMAMGDAEEMRKTAELLDKVSGSLVLAYTSKTGKSDSEIQDLMNLETWMSAEEALGMGFADEIAEKMDMAACAKFVPVMAKAKFKHIPDEIVGIKTVVDENGNEFLHNKRGEFLAFGTASQLREIADLLDKTKQLFTEIIPESLSGDKQPPDNERDLEAFLRDAGGYTRKAAKSIIADGFKGLLRDAEAPKMAVHAEDVLRDAEQPKPADIVSIEDNQHSNVAKISPKDMDGVKLLVLAESIAPTKTLTKEVTKR